MSKVDEANLKQIVDFLVTKNLKFSSCESFTGGGFANTITNFQGVSKVYLGSIVAYANETKHKFLHVKKRIFKKYGAISQECSEAMVLGCQKVMKSHLCVSFTGNGDVDVIEGKEPFKAYISILYLGDLHSYCFSRTNVEKMTRVKFKQEAISFVFAEIVKILR